MIPLPEYVYGRECGESEKVVPLESVHAYGDAVRAEPPALTERELELLNGMIEVQLYHAKQCDGIANRKMADRQKGWDMERVALLRKLGGIKQEPTT